MIKQFACAALAASLLMACSKGDGDGKVVSAPETPVNAPVSADTHPTDAAQTPGASSFTSDQAKGHIENAGYTGVGALTQTPDGIWHGTATKDGKSVAVSVDYKGAVSAQ